MLAKGARAIEIETRLRFVSVRNACDQCCEFRADGKQLEGAPRTSACTLKDARLLLVLLQAARRRCSKSKLKHRVRVLAALAYRLISWAEFICVAREKDRAGNQTRLIYSGSWYQVWIILDPFWSSNAPGSRLWKFLFMSFYAYWRNHHGRVLLYSSCSSSTITLSLWHQTGWDDHWTISLLMNTCYPRKWMRNLCTDRSLLMCLIEGQSAYGMNHFLEYTSLDSFSQSRSTLCNAIFSFFLFCSVHLNPFYLIDKSKSHPRWESYEKKFTIQKPIVYSSNRFNKTNRTLSTVSFVCEVLHSLSTSSRMPFWVL